jgi:hypothetical protein
MPVDFLDLGLASSPQKALRRRWERRIPGRGVRHPQPRQLLGVRAALYFDEVRELAETVRRLLQRAVDSGRQRLFRLAARLDAAAARPIAA